MTTQNLLEGKNVLIVDDEDDILDTLEDLLPMCNTVRAGNYETAEKLLNNSPFDMAILDIMGVSGYRLLEICVKKKIVAVMLTAHAVTSADIHKSFDQGAAYYIPKQEMANIEVFLNDVLEAIQKGENTWSRWYNRLSRFGEKVFGEEWAKNEEDLLDKFTFHI
jgi:DNA-binding response OmpR family regulator